MLKFCKCGSIMKDEVCTNTKCSFSAKTGTKIKRQSATKKATKPRKFKPKVVLKNSNDPDSIIIQVTNVLKANKLFSLADEYEKSALKLDGNLEYILNLTKEYIQILEEDLP